MDYDLYSDRFSRLNRAYAGLNHEPVGGGYFELTYAHGYLEDLVEGLDVLNGEGGGQVLVLLVVEDEVLARELHYLNSNQCMPIAIINI